MNLTVSNIPTIPAKPWTVKTSNVSSNFNFSLTLHPQRHRVTEITANGIVANGWIKPDAGVITVNPTTAPQQNPYAEKPRVVKQQSKIDHVTAPSDPDRLVITQERTAWIVAPNANHKFILHIYVFIYLRLWRRILPDPTLYPKVPNHIKIIPITR